MFFVQQFYFSVARLSGLDIVWQSVVGGEVNCIYVKLTILNFVVSEFVKQYYMVSLELKLCGQNVFKLKCKLYNF